MEELARLALGEDSARAEELLNPLHLSRSLQGDDAGLALLLAESRPDLADRAFLENLASQLAAASFTGEDPSISIDDVSFGARRSVASTDTCDDSSHSECDDG